MAKLLIFKVMKRLQLITYIYIEGIHEGVSIDFNKFNKVFNF